MPVGFEMSPEYSETSPLMSILKKRDRQLFASRSGTRDKKRAVVRIECRISNGMKIAGEFFRRL